jgi:hypothetical protein
MPSITYHRISTQRISAFKDDTGDAMARFQVSSWDDSYSGVKGTAQKVQAAMQRWASSTGVVTIQDTFLDAEHDLPFEPQTETYHVAQDYLVWFKE